MYVVGAPPSVELLSLPGLLLVAPSAAGPVQTVVNDVRVPALGPVVLVGEVTWVSPASSGKELLKLPGAMLGGRDLGVRLERACPCFTFWCPQPLGWNGGLKSPSWEETRRVPFRHCVMPGWGREAWPVEERQG
jgi:hypothetical protein